MNPAGKSPEQGDLDAVLACAVAFTIFDAGPSSTVSSPVLRSRDGQDIARLRDALRIAAGGRCMCAGDATLRIEAADGSTTTIGLHHGTSIRWPERWKLDAELSSPDDFADFLAALGWARYRDELQARRDRATDDARALERWIDAMPTPLKSQADAVLHVAPGARTATLVGDLSSALGSDEAAAGALLRWLGCGKGPWSGFPSYEAVPTAMLTQLPVSVLVRVLEAELDPSQLLGAARYCASSAFRRNRKVVPRAVVARLQRFLDASGSTAQRDAFYAAFSRVVRGGGDARG